MHENNAKKLADVFEPIRPSAELLAKTEALMRSAPVPIRKPASKKPLILRTAAMAAALALVCSAALIYVKQTAPTDHTGSMGIGLALSASEARTVPTPLAIAAEESVLSSADLLAKARNTHGTDAAALTAKARCTKVEQYIPTAENAGFVAALFCTLELEEIGYAENLPYRLKKGDRISAVWLCYDDAAIGQGLARMTDPTVQELFLSTDADGNLYTENGAELLGESVWLIHP